MKLEDIIRGPYMIVGVGNVERGDDGIGCRILSKLDTIHKLDCGPVPENYTGKIRASNPETIILVDAVDFGGKPGERILTEAENAEGVVLSTHALPLSLFCKLFPRSKIYLLGIQPGSLTERTDSVEAAGEQVAKELNSLLK